jgi:hypothetical protein
MILLFLLLGMVFMSFHAFPKPFYTIYTQIRSVYMIIMWYNNIDKKMDRELLYEKKKIKSTAN